MKPTHCAYRFTHSMATCIMLLAVVMFAPVAQGGPYVRAGLGYDWSSSTRFSDRNCAAIDPPALFGCAIGEDGRSLGARGGFGGSPNLEAGLGYQLAPGFRVEALGTYIPDFAFAGNANFLATPQPQPVSADLRSLTGMVVGYLDLAEFGFGRPGMAEPFIGGGVGVARHRISPVTYSFPGLGAGAATVIRGGTSTSFSFMLAAGLALPVSEQVTLDVSYRYRDLGKVRTRAGLATITRPSFTSQLDIAGTEARLTSHGISAGLRYGF